MRRWLALLLVPIALAACQSQGGGVYVHPSFTDPTLGPGKAIDKIAVLPFGTSLHDSDDPDHLAPLLMDQHLMPVLDARGDYHFIAPTTVQYAVEREAWDKEFATFMDVYAKTGKSNKEFLAKLADVLRCDAFLVPVVDLWMQDEADVRENASSATYVGATITIIDQKGTPGRVVFRVSIEDYLEAARTETADRSITSSAGNIQVDRGARLFRAPPFEDVVARVVDQLVEALPVR